jgi:hypothetical protein
LEFLRSDLTFNIQILNSNICLVAAVLTATFAAVAASGQVNSGVPWPATDALGRSLPLAGEVGLPKTNRFVGIFYFIDHLDWPRSQLLGGPYDVAKILQRDPDALSKPDSPLWGGNGVAHYWGEPLYGYYRSDDPWVLRHHAQLLADAGIDVVIFDTSNAETYPQSYLALCQAFHDVRQSGGHTPQVAFLVNTRAGETAEKIYHDLYQKNLFPELWFNWLGKPLMICDPDEAGPELKQFFTLRGAHWPFTMTNSPDAWYWEATFPQPYGYSGDPGKPEEINVSVAQNLRWDNGQVENMSSGAARGRSFHDDRQNLAPGSVDHGANFQEQWQRALDLQPPFVMVTGWNEWVAGRWVRPGQPILFVDQYNEEFSRDIEPMRDGHGDDYYWQLITNVRRYKGVPALPIASAPQTISIGNDFSQWRDVQPEFDHHPVGTPMRAFAGIAGTSYTNLTARNEFVLLKVARDATNIYLYARTLKPITSTGDANWMWLFLDTDQNASTGWCGYDFVVNRVADADGKFWLEKNLGGWQWQRVTPVELRVKDSELQLAIPRVALGLAADDSRLSFDFKWADNLQHPGDVMDFYLSGDVAPEGRFNYRYLGN